MSYNIAVIGATGNVGRNTIDILFERNFPIDNLYCFASANSKGKKVAFGKDNLEIRTLDGFDFSNVSIAFFAAGANVSSRYVPLVSKSTLVIDKSSFYRMEKDIPLIIPEVNGYELKGFAKRNIVSNPNCVAIPLAMVLKPLQEQNPIKRVVLTTFQSVSGAGKDAMDELFEQTKGKFVSKNIAPKLFSKQIAFNVMPMIGKIMENGETQEELKIRSEVQKILDLNVEIAVTCVRVPVFVGHCLSVNIEFENNFDAKEAMRILAKAPGIVVMDNQAAYNTPIEVVGEDSIYVSRIRNDQTAKNTLSIWIVSDNLRKGAALNAVHIAEKLVREYF